jgi:phosphohistidine phosphatase
MVTDQPRQLLLLRHAKSAWPDLPDQDRPLAGRGRRDAPAVGRWLRETGLIPDQVWCSPALRARQTWELAAAELGAQPPASYPGQLYGATGSQLADMIRQAPAAARALLLVGHNPAVQEAVLALAAPPDSEAGADSAAAFERAAIKFPTGAVAVLEVGLGWPRLSPGAARLTRFVVPRELRGRPGRGAVQDRLP